jgi:alpha-amylase
MSVNFVFCLHNHQPVDNFDPVFVQAYDDAYLPFLDRIEKRSKIKFVAHYSGPLLEWLDKHRPRFLDRLRALVEAGRLELLGGGFYEPIFTMLPDEDAAGQVAMMSDFLSRRFGRRPQGAWLPERVWEQSLVPTLAKAGVRYTILDDFHFRAAGVSPADLAGAFVTEDRGSLLRVFPLQEELRYSIPYKEPQHTIDFLRRFADDSGLRTIVYADDGEKFGLWPNTKRHVYDEGWLDRFLDALDGASDVQTKTFSEVLEKSPRPGRVFLPSTSYREMGEWSLPPVAAAEYEGLADELKRQDRFDAAKPFLLGGTWRGFKAKYPEANLMYGRMLHVSRKARKSGNAKALEELYRGQCNCGYWHGVFGGLHLPHLRGSIYRHLIQAEKLADGQGSGFEMVDLDLDGAPEVRLYNEKLNVFISPAEGGSIVELDARDAGVNLLATLARRKEHYHAKIRQATSATGEARSIHDVVVSKVADLDRHLAYDAHLRGSLVDHFFAPDATLEDASKGWKEIGDFAGRWYGPSPPDSPTLKLLRRGKVGGVTVLLAKKIVLADDITITYGLESEAPVEAIFGVEFNVALLSPTMPDAVVTGPDAKRTGALGDRVDSRGVRMSISDQWYGLDLEFVAPRGADFWMYPVHTVSQSESGFDLTYQSTVILPHWRIKLEPGKPWSVTLTHGVKKR